MPRKKYKGTEVLKNPRTNITSKEEVQIKIILTFLG